MCKELAKELRSELKEIGYNRTMLSVTSDYDSINVNIKSIDVDFKKVAELANNYKKIDRDHTGDILQGGNIFVSIEYAESLMESLENKYMSKAQETFEAIQNSNELENVFIKDGIYAFLGDFQMIWFRVPQSDGTVKRYKCYNCAEGISEVFAKLFLNEKIDMLETSKSVQEVSIVEELKQESQQVINSINTETLESQKESLKAVSTQLDKVYSVIEKNIDNEEIRLQLRDIENDLKWQYSSLDEMIENQTMPNADDFNNIETLKTVYVTNWSELPEEIQNYILSCDKYWISLQSIELYKNNRIVASIEISGHHKHDIEINSIGAGDKGNLFQWNTTNGYTLNNLEVSVDKQENKIKVTHNEYEKIMKGLALRVWKSDETKITMKQYDEMLEQYEVLPFEINCNDEELKKIINTYADNEDIKADRVIYRGSIDKSILYNLYQNKGYNDLYNEYYQVIICKDELKTILTYCEGDFIAEVYNSDLEYQTGIERTKKFIEEM